MALCLRAFHITFSLIPEESRLGGPLVPQCPGVSVVDFVLMPLTAPPGVFPFHAPSRHRSPGPFSDRSPSPNTAC